MATAPTSSESLAVSSWASPGAEGSKSDRYLARRLAAAAADYKSVAALTFLLAASVVGMLWLLLGIVLEHWVVPGGLPGWFRWAWLAVVAVALTAAVVRWIVPLLRYRVNLVYAARAIEADHPDLHNDLVNAVLVKAHADANAHAVVRTLERRAAKRLSAVPAEGVVDRGLALRLAVALAGLVAAACIYELAAPKSLLVSAARLVAPWAAVAPPARVRIERPQLAWRHPDAAADAGGPSHPLEAIGGTVTLVRGRQLVVTSRVRGLDRDERADVVVSRVRDDGGLDTATPPWRVAMTPDADGRQVAILPDASRGVDHGLEFVITAGDATSDRLRVAVVDTPALLVREVKYDYPDYTRRPSETLAWQGDLRGVEGTRVTIIAEGNRPLDAAWIDLGCDGKKDVPLRISQHDLARATGSFSLRLNADRTGPAASSYRLGFVPRGSGASDREDAVLEKLEHRIEVTADLAPEVMIEEPRQQVLRVPPDAPVTVRVRALDSDFTLTRVAIETRLKGGEIQPEIQLFRGDKPGVLKIDAALVPAKQGAGPGSVLEYRALAVDNRPETPNIARTEWRSLEIDPSAPQPPAPRPDPAQQPRGPQGKQAQRPDQRPPDGQPQQNQGKDQGKPEDGRQDGGEREQPQNQQPQQKPADQPAGQRPDQQSGGGQQEGQQGSGQGGNQPGQQGAQGKQEGKQEGNGGQAAPQGEAGNREQSDKQQGQGGRAEQGKNEQGKAANDSAAGQQPATKPQAGGQRGQQREKGAVAHDGTNDGEAMERLLDNRRQERGAQPTQPSEQRGEGMPQNGEQKQQPQAGEPRTQDGQSDQHDHAECRNADGKPCGKQGCPSCKGGQSQGQGQGQGQGGARGNEGAAGQKQGGDQAGASTESAQGEAGQAAGEKPGQGKGVAGSPGNGGDAAEAPRREPGDHAAEGTQPTASGAEAPGQAAKQRPGNQEQQDGEQGQQDQKGKAAGQKEAGSGQPGDAGAAQAGGTQMPSGNAVGAGGKGGGDQGARPDGPAGAAPPKKMEWTEQDLAHARNAADLALEHLRDAVNGGKSDVLDALGWTPEQARAFLERWEAMRRQADTGDAAAKGRFERTLQSLGLRPDGVRSSRDVPADAKGGQAEGRRSRPPADYRDQFRAFLQGTSVGNGTE